MLLEPKYDERTAMWCPDAPPKIEAKSAIPKKKRLIGNQKLYS